MDLKSRAVELRDRVVAWARAHLLEISIAAVAVIGVFAVATCAAAEETAAAPYVPVGIAANTEAALVLQDVQTACPTGSKRALVFKKDAREFLIGCWLARDGVVYFALEDASGGRVSVGDVNWAPGKRPAGA